MNWLKMVEVFIHEELFKALKYLNNSTIYNVVLGVLQLSVILIPLVAKGKIYNHKPASFFKKNKVFFWNRLNKVVYYMVIVQALIIYLAIVKDDKVKIEMKTIYQPTKETIKERRVGDTSNTSNKQGAYLSDHNLYPRVIDSSYLPDRKLFQLRSTFQLFNSGDERATNIKSRSIYILNLNDTALASKDEEFKQSIDPASGFSFVTRILLASIPKKNDTLYVAIKYSYRTEKKSKNYYAYYFLVKDPEFRWYGPSTERTNKILKFIKYHKLPF